MKYLRMSRLDASDTVRMRSDRRAAEPICARAYVRAALLGRYCGKRRWMQS